MSWVKFPATRNDECMQSIPLGVSLTPRDLSLLSDVDGPGDPF